MILNLNVFKAVLGSFSLRWFWIHLLLGVLDSVFWGVQFWLDLLQLHHTFHFYKWSWKIFLCSEQILVLFHVISVSACTCHQDICQIVLPFILCSLCATTWHFASESTVFSCSGNGFSQASDRVLSLIFMWTFSIIITKPRSLVIILCFN